MLLSISHNGYHFLGHSRSVNSGSYPMEAIVALPPIHGSCALQLLVQSPHGFPSRLPFNAVRQIRNQGFKSKSLNKHRNITPFASGIRAISFPLTPIRLEGDEEPILEDSTSSRSVKLEEKGNVLSVATVNNEKPEGTIAKGLLRQLLYTLFCFAIGFSSLGTVRVPAIAAPVANEVILEKKDKGRDNKQSLKSHEYADCTKRLLETVSDVLRSIEEVRKGNGDINQVQQAMKAVNLKKEEMQKEIMSRLYAEVRELRRDKGRLVKRAGQIIDEIVKAKGDYDKLKAKAVKDTDKARMERLDQRMRELEQDYNDIWERVSEIDDSILRRETVALSFGVREISFIERECEQLVDRFKQEMRQKNIR